MPFALRQVIVCLLITLSPFAASQDMSEYYSVQHADEFELDFANDLYVAGNRKTEEARKELPHHLNLAFGEHPKQRLDLYLPRKPPQKAPVLLFLHGGGFSEGDRAHYGFIAAPYAEHGIITVVSSYRLSSDGFTYPAPLDDAKAAVIWIHAHISEYGGNPQSIFVSGHSAGAILAADIGADRSWLTTAGIPVSVLNGIVPVSGQYQLEAGQLDNYAPTTELKLRASPIRHIKDPAPAAVIAFGENSGDPLEDGRRETSQKLHSSLKAKGVNAVLVALKGENHIDTVFSLGDADSPLFKAVLHMIREAR